MNSLDDLIPTLMAVWNVHDMDGFGQLFAPDADFVNAFGDHLVGRDHIVRDHTERHRTMFRTSRISADGMKIRELGAGRVAVHYRWYLTDVLAPDGKAFDRGGRFLQILERQAAGWFVVASQNTFTSTST